MEDRTSVFVLSFTHCQPFPGSLRETPEDGSIHRATGTGHSVTGTRPFAEPPSNVRSTSVPSKEGWKP